MGDFTHSPLDEALVELTAPDGRVFQFKYVTTIPYAEEEYVVLMELEKDAQGEEQLLITRVEEAEDGQLAFVVAQEEDVIQAVFEKYMAMSLQAALDAADLEDACDCGCGHDHGCHEHHCDCGCDHHHEQES